MSIGLAISSALSGLRVVQKSIDTVSQNVANAMTPGYTRKDAPQEAVVLGGSGAGVRSGQLQRTVDLALQRRVMGQESSLAGLNTKESYLSLIEQLQGRPEDSTSLASSFSQLQSSFEKLSSNPDSQPYQSEAITNANSLAAQLNDISRQTLTLRNQTQTDIASNLKEVNANLKKIADLNDTIVAQSQMGRSTADLEDLRDQSLQNLSQYMEISYVTGPDNRMAVSTKNGQTLVAQSAKQFTFSPDRLTDQSFYGPQGHVSGIIDQNGDDVTAQFSGGQIGALIDLRDNILPQYQAQMDQFASQMARRFQAQGLTLFTAQDGTIPPDTPKDTVGFAAQIQVNVKAQDPSYIRFGDSPPVMPGTGGDADTQLPISNELITRVLDFTFGKYSNVSQMAQPSFRTTGLGPGGYTANLSSGLPAQATLGDYIQNLVAVQGQSRAQVTGEIQNTEALKVSLESKLSDSSGVNVDTELAKLTILQKSYGASAQVIRVSQQLLDEVMSIVR